MAIKPNEVFPAETIIDRLESDIDDLLKRELLYGAPHNPEYWFTGSQRTLTEAHLEELASRYREAGWKVEINERYIKLRNPSA